LTGRLTERLSTALSSFENNIFDMDFLFPYDLHAGEEK